jgi:hypothetical protein
MAEVDHGTNPAPARIREGVEQPHRVCSTANPTPLYRASLSIGAPDVRRGMTVAFITST